MPSTSSGPTRPSCTAPMRARIRRSRIPTSWRATGRRRRELEAAGAVSRPGARRGVRQHRSCRRSPTVRDRIAACCARRSNCSARPACRSRTASGCCRTARSFQDRIPAGRAFVPAAPRALHQEPRDARYRGELRLVDAVQYAGAPKTSTSTSTIQRFSMSATPGDAMRSFFSSQAAADQGLVKSCGRRQVRRIDAMIEKIIGGRKPRGTDGRLPRLRSRVPRRPLLGAAMVSTRRTGSPTGTYSAARRSRRVMPVASALPTCGGIDGGKAAKARAGEKP